MSEYEVNQRVADKLCQDLEWEGQTFREGQHVALLDGRVVAVADNLDDAIVAAKMVNPDPRRGMIVDVYRPDRVDVIR